MELLLSLPPPAQLPVCVVVGAGPGLGAALVRRFLLGGCLVAACSRGGSSAVADGANLEAARLGLPQRATGFALDSTDRQQITQVFDEIRRTLGPIRVLIYNAAQRKFRLESVLTVSPETVEAFWRVNCLGALLCAQQALPDMLAAHSQAPAIDDPASESNQAHNLSRWSGMSVASGTSSPSALQWPHRGTILLTGASASVRSLGGLSSMSIGKFGLRALSQSLAREVGSSGVHVAHILVDGAVDSPLLRSYVEGQVTKAQTDPEKARKLPSSLTSTSSAIPRSHHFLDPHAVAEQYWALHSQPHSCWTQELDVRPYPEPIFSKM